jgi:hypothetical protein
MYSVLRNGDVSDEPAARAAAERAGVVGVVVMRPVRIDQKLSGRSTYSGPMHGGYWGGYFGYGWGSPWGTGGVAIRTDTIVTIETLVYSLRENKLLWGGQTRTNSPKNLDRLIEDTATQVANELVRLGLMRRD